MSNVQVMMLAKRSRVGLALAGLLTALVTGGARVTAEPSPTSRFDWVFDDSVLGIGRVGNRLFVGGGFKNVLPTSGAVGNLYALSPATGAVVPSVIPRLDEEATALTPDGSGGYFVATFTTFGPGGARGKVVHIRNDGSFDPSFVPPPQVAGSPGAMARVGPSLVLAGFLQVNGVSRPLVALDAVTGALSPWVPALPPGDTAVWDVESANGVLFVVSGSFLGPARYVTAFDGVTGTLLWQSDVTGAPGFGGAGQLGLAGSRLIVGLGRLYALDPATGVVDSTWAAGQVPTGSVLTLTVGGSAIYVGGPFATFHGQPRANLAAVDVATGALLPWSPQSSEAVFDMAASPTGTVFVAATSQAMTINGHARRAVFEIDAAGAVTAYASEAVAASATLLHLSSSGVLFVGGEPGFAGTVARGGLAEIDVTTGALLPPTITMSFNGGPAAISGLIELNGVLYMQGAFDTVNGQARDRAAAVDVATGTVLQWPAPGVSLGGILFGNGRHIYFSIPGAAGAANHRRVDAVTGVVDTAWLPSVSGTLHLVDGDVMRIAPVSAGGCNSGAVIGTLDPVTGGFLEWLRTMAYNGGLLTADGDTLYVAGNVPNPQPGGCYVGAILFAYDRKTGTPVSAPPAAGAINGLGVADGRLVVTGFDLFVGGSPFSGLVEVPRPTGAGGLRQPGLTGGLIAGRPSGVHGDLLVAEGFVSRRPRVAGFGLLGAQSPSNLRTRAVGGAVEFSWDGPASPPAGGYVLEAGLGAGQTAVAVPVGGGTTFVTPLAVPGPVFVRMRTQGSAEVSNEVVVGCVAPPRPPTTLTTTLAGTALTLAWTAPADEVLGYTLIAGSASGLNDAATLPLGPQTSISGHVPGGTFFVRVTASNACGTSGPSGEVFFTIGAPDPLPEAPTNLAATVNGNTASLSWTAPAAPVTGYVLEAGTAAGLANLGTLQIGATPSLVVPAVPAGTYVLRVRAITSAGSGAPSADVVVVVP